MKTYYAALCMVVEAPDELTARNKIEGWNKRVKFPDYVKDHSIMTIQEADE